MLLVFTLHYINFKWKSNIQVSQSQNIFDIIFVNFHLCSWLYHGVCIARMHSRWYLPAIPSRRFPFTRTQIYPRTLIYPCIWNLRLEMADPNLSVTMMSPIESLAQKLYNVDNSEMLPRHNSLQTEGYSMKLMKQECHSNSRAKFFGFRLVNTWNRLPEKVITSKSVNCFKGRYDRRLCHHSAEE